jgi:hypothetical protein
MERDHLSGPDAQVPFTTSNYSVSTTSQKEWWYVYDPVRGKDVLGLTTWPVEAQDTISRDHRRGATSPKPLGSFSAAMGRVNADLREARPTTAER